MLARVERLIRVLTPALDLLIAVGDRVSRVLEPDDPSYVLARMAPDGESAPRGLRVPLRSRRAEESEAA
jgi:hypothetical protein